MSQRSTSSFPSTEKWRLYSGSWVIWSAAGLVEPLGVLTAYLLIQTGVWETWRTPLDTLWFLPHIALILFFASIYGQYHRVTGRPHMTTKEVLTYQGLLAWSLMFDIVTVTKHLDKTSTHMTDNHIGQLVILLAVMTVTLLRLLVAHKFRITPHDTTRETSTLS